MPTDLNRDLMSTKDVEEFNAAIAEYRAVHGDDLDAPNERSVLGWERQVQGMLHGAHRIGAAGGR